MGDTRGAIVTLTSSIERADDPCDQAWTRLKIGMCRMDARRDDLAMLELTAAARANALCRSAAVASSIAINQAWLLRWSDPPGALARLDDLAKSGPEGVETLLLRGYLAADRGAIEQSDHYLARAAALEPPDADWPWEIARAQAELADLRGGLLDDRLAELHYRRATAMVATLRASARSRSAYLVASHRGPYDGLIALLARQGRWLDVLAVVLDLDASDMLRATADERTARDRASEVEIPPPRARMTSSSDLEDVVAAWQPRDLVIVIAPSRRAIGPGRERAYRLQIHGGQVTGEDVGDASAAQAWADALFADPGDRAAAQALGRMIVPAGPASGMLHVLAIGSLGKVPLAALRDDDGALVIARRPLVKILALRATRPEATGAGPAIVLADPRGDLPGARMEGAVVARALGVSAQLSGAASPVAATRSQLWATGDAALLHIAAHVGARGRWRALHLADGEVDPAEIVQRGLAPRLAVLAGCGSAAAMDEEGWGSIAAALLESGTAVVVATDRSVGDDAALAVMRGFYAQPDWRADPARALARVQQALDTQTTSSDDVTRLRAWAAFSVFGRPPVAPPRSGRRAQLRDLRGRRGDGIPLDPRDGSIHRGDSHRGE